MPDANSARGSQAAPYGNGFCPEANCGTPVPMGNVEPQQWLEWARELQALGQTGLHFAQTPFDSQRYGRLVELAAEIVAQHSAVPAARVHEDFMRQRGYATTKVDVRGAAFRDGKVLLVQERADERWAMPGGWADVGDRPSEMVEREVREESGLLVKARRVVAVYDANRDGRPLEFYHAYKIIFLCDIVGGEPGPSNETLAAAFFEPTDLPPLSQPRTQAHHVREALAHLDSPTRPTVFD